MAWSINDAHIWWIRLCVCKLYSFQVIYMCIYHVIVFITIKEYKLNYWLLHDFFQAFCFASFFFFSFEGGRGHRLFIQHATKKLYLVSICFEVVNETLQVREEIIPIWDQDRIYIWAHTLEIYSWSLIYIDEVNSFKYI